MAKHLFDVKKGKKDSVVEFITGSFEDHKERMRAIHRSWALTLAWTKGHQNVDFNPRTVTYNQIPRRVWQSQLISNLMLPIVRANVARLATAIPTWDVVPATPDEEDIQISRVSKMIADHYWQKLDMSQDLLRVLFWQATCCSAFLKIGWDADAGQDIQIAANDVNDELLTQFIEASGIYSLPKLLDLKVGEPFIEPIPPFNLAFDPLIGVLKKSDWSIETQIRSLDWVVENFGNKWKDKLSEDASIDILLHPYVFDQNNSKPTKGIVTHELFVKHNKRFKKGLYCLIANEKVLVPPKEHPYNHGELPYAHFLEIYDPASFYGTCSAEQIRPNQERYNKIQGVITDCINVLGKPKWINPFGSGVQSITNSPNEVLRYRFPLKPEQIQPKPLPAYIQSTLEQIRRDMQDTASFHNVSQAQNEPGLRSGRAIIALQGADDEQIGPTLIWFDNALSRTGRLLLQTINQFVSEERVVQITGEFNQLETVTYSGEMLQGKNQGDYYDVRVNTYNRNFMSRAAKENLLVSLTQMGYLNPEKDRKLVLNMLGLATTTDIFDELASERARQWKEIQLIIQGQEVKVEQGEDHEEHLLILKKFMASGRRDELEPQILQLIQKHLEDHERVRIVEALRQQILLAGIMNNVRGSNGQSSGAGGNSQGETTRKSETGVNRTTGV